MIGRLVRRLRRREPQDSPWAEVVARGLPERPTADGPRVLCATSIGGHAVVRAVDGLVAAGLWLRGAEPRLLLCDAALPACEHAAYVSFPDPREFVRRGPRRLCGSCFGGGSSYLAPLPVDVERYSRFAGTRDAREAAGRAAAMDVEERLAFVDDGMRLGEQARAGTYRFFGKAHLDDEPPDLVEAVTRRYAAAALVAARVAERTLEAFEPDCVVAHHGVYVPQGVLGEVARRRGVRVVNWSPSYRSSTVTYSHGDTYHRTMLTEPLDRWEDRELSEHDERALLDYLAARRRGAGDWSWITPDAGLRTEYQQRDRLVAELGLDPERPVVGLLTNVMWDAQLYYAGHAFGDMLDWLWFTIDHFARHPELQLVIRVHPHEVKAGNREPVGERIAARYRELPPNVHVVPFDHEFNTYALMDLCRAVLIYGTKTGVELAPFGTPVIVAADAWIRGKGLTYDASTVEEYGALLERLPDLGPLDEDTVTRARRYAHHYFFRRMIPLRSLVEADGGLGLAIERIEDLAPGRDPGLDVICDGILHGRPFEYDG